MSTKTTKPDYYRYEITENELKKLEEIMDKIINDKNAYDFRAPVDYETLGLLDYPKIIKNPMDLGTCKEKLLNGEYKLIQDFMEDIDLIWDNCRTYNQAGSPIVKMANALDKKIHGLIDKQFKHLKIKEEQDKSKSQLSMDDKLKLSDMIKQQSNEGLTQIVKIILKSCPDGIEDIDNDKLQIKIDFLSPVEFNLIKEYCEKTNSENKKSNE